MLPPLVEIPGNGKNQSRGGEILLTVRKTRMDRPAIYRVSARGKTRSENNGQARGWLTEILPESSIRVAKGRGRKELDRAVA